MAFISQGQGSTNGKTEIMKYFQGNRLSTRTVMHGHIIEPPERILDHIALEPGVIMTFIMWDPPTLQHPFIFPISNLCMDRHILIPNL